MTPHEKAVDALNRRIERLQAALRAAEGESARRFLVESIVALLGVGEALNDYLKAFGQYAKRRHAELKQAQEGLEARHAELLTSGKQLLEKLKAAPTDRALKKEIESAQKSMASIQKTLRRDANALQRDVAPGLATIDQLAESVRRLGEAEQADALKRLLKAIVADVREFYATQPSLPAKNLVDAAAWEKSALADLERAGGFADAYARASYQAILALELMTIAVAENPPPTAEEVARRGQESVAARLKAITARFASA